MVTFDINATDVDVLNAFGTEVNGKTCELIYRKK
jgi:hypothetical protein